MVFSSSCNISMSWFYTNISFFRFYSHFTFQKTMRLTIICLLFIQKYKTLSYLLKLKLLAATKGMKKDLNY